MTAAWRPAFQYSDRCMSIMQAYYTSLCKEWALSLTKILCKSKKRMSLQRSIMTMQDECQSSWPRLGHDVREKERAEKEEGRDSGVCQADRTAEALLAVLFECIKINAVSTHRRVEALTCYYFVMYALAQGWPWDREILHSGLFALHLLLPLFEEALPWKREQWGVFSDTSSLQ